MGGSNGMQCCNSTRREIGQKHPDSVKDWSFSHPPQAWRTKRIFWCHRRASPLFLARARYCSLCSSIFLTIDLRDTRGLATWQWHGLEHIARRRRRRFFSTHRPLDIETLTRTFPPLPLLSQRGEESRIFILQIIWKKMDHWHTLTFLKKKKYSEQRYSL